MPFTSQRPRSGANAAFDGGLLRFVKDFEAARLRYPFTNSKDAARGKLEGRIKKEKHYGVGVGSASSILLRTAFSKLALNSFGRSS